MPPKRQVRINNNNTNNKTTVTTTAATTTAATTTANATNTTNTTNNNSATTAKPAAAAQSAPAKSVASAAKSVANQAAPAAVSQPAPAATTDANKMSREELIQALSCAQKSIDVHQRLLATLRPTEPPIDVRVQALVQAQTDLQNVLTNITLVVSTLSQEVSRLIVAVGQDSEKDVAKLSLCFNCDTRGHALSDCTQARLDSTVAALNLPKNQQKRALRAAQRERLRMASAAAAGAPKTPASAPAAVAASQQFAASTSENLRPLMPIDVSDGKRKRTLDAVIASGADVNVILVATANQFQAARRDTRSVSLQGMTGAFQSRGAIALTVSTAAGVSAVLWFHMVDTYPHDMMIGSGGMSLLKISLVATASDVNLVASPPAGGGKAVSFPLRDMGPDEPVAFLSVYLAK